MKKVMLFLMLGVFSLGSINSNASPRDDCQYVAGVAQQAALGQGLSNDAAYEVFVATYNACDSRR